MRVAHEQHLVAGGARRASGVARRWGWMLLLCAAPTLAGTTDVRQVEIEHLFAYLQHSGCKFNRNGTWHSAAEASDHLRSKYNYLAEKGLAPTAEIFVQRGASASSLSGKPYLVQCGAESAVESAGWFLAELKRFRDSQPVAK